jgi:uncharacterized protein
MRPINMIAHPRSLVPRIEKFSTDIISSLPAGYAYHCIEHTAMVVEFASVIAKASSLTEDEASLLTMAAWLHDVGFKVRYHGHEKESCAIARENLANDLNAEDMVSIEEAIMGTEIPQRATHAISHALCDADLLYMGGDHFFVWSARLREEHSHVLGHEYTDLQWIEYNIDFVRNHTYFTAFAQKYYGEGLMKNLRALEEMRAALL